jgi:hypothetical protein
MYTKIIAFMLFAGMWVLGAQAQDLILKRNGEELSVKIKAVSDSVITYAITDKDNPQAAEIQNIISVSEVAVIKYASGKRISFVEPLASDVAPARSPAYIQRDAPTTLTNSDLYLKGRADATMYYQGYRGAATGTLLVGLVSPLVGLIPAIACSSTQPSPYRVVTPDARMLSNPEYQRGYLREARRIKSRRVWQNWGIAFGVNLALVVLVSR